MFEREGQGWRLAWDSQRDPFPLLIGGEGWASELTAAEGAALQHALDLLVRQHRDLADTLMDEETIGLEFTGTLDSARPQEGGELWVALEGDRREWGVRFVLQPAAGLRGLEGAWGTGAAIAVAEAFAEVGLALPHGLVPPDP